MRPLRTSIAAALYTELFWEASKLAVTPPALRGTWTGLGLFAFCAYGVPFLGTALTILFDLLTKWEAGWMVVPSYLVLLRANWDIAPFPWAYVLLRGCDLWLANAAGLIAGIVLKKKYAVKR